MFVGEAPGATEDREGRPFVGASGRFLSEGLALIGLSRADVYVTNVVKYHPPGNRTPDSLEILASLPLLVKEVDIVGPRVVVPMGAVALRAFVDGGSITSIHGVPTVGRSRGKYVVVPMFHPSYCIRNGNKGREIGLRDFKVLEVFL